MQIADLTPRQAFGLMVKAAREKGGSFVYRPEGLKPGSFDPQVAPFGFYRQGSCDYVERNDDRQFVGSCIVGCALFNNNLADVEELAIIETAFNLVEHNLGGRRDTAKVFQAAQRVQDLGGTWLQALRAAANEIRDLEDNPEIHEPWNF